MPRKNANYAKIKRAKNGTYYYTLHNGGNHENIGTNKEINDKMDILETIVNNFPGWKIIDTTAKDYEDTNPINSHE
jgi:hypothetical protein